MSYTYTVKQGDTLNAIAQAHGFSDYKSAGITSVPSGDFNLIRPNEQITIPNYDPNKVTTLPTQTSPVISSKDNQNQFNQDSNTLNTIVGSLTKKVDPLTGEVSKVDTTTVDKTQTPYVDPNKKTTTEATTTTGNTVFDNLQAETKAKQAEDTAKAEQAKLDYNNLFQTSLANLDATTENTINTIKTTYDKRILEQTRLNNINTSRVQAYGLASGGQYTPIAFSDSVTNREREGADAITALENERNNLIQQAKTARDTGRSDLMRTHLEDLQKIDDRIRKQLQDVATASQQEYTRIRDARLNAEADHKAKVAEALLEFKNVAPKMIDAYTKADDKGKDAIIKQVMAQNGLDYASVYSTLEGAIITKAKSALSLRKEEATVKATEALANQRNAKKGTTSTKVTPTQMSSDIPASFTSEAEAETARQAFIDKYGNAGNLIWKDKFYNSHKGKYDYSTVINKTSKTIRVQSPDGQVGSIPQDKLEEALKNGFKKL